MESAFTTPQGMARAAFHAMETTIVVIAPEATLPAALRLTCDLFDEWERTLSRYRAESELARLNAAAGFRVTVSPLLLTVTLKALDAACATRGVFDPTVMQQMIQIGHDRSFDALPLRLPAAPPRQPARLGAWREIVVDEARRLVRLPPGVGLDFGGIAKGLAVDAALDLLTEQGIAPALVDAGGDLAVRGLPPALPHWPIVAPGKDERWVISVERGALATAGLSHRHHQIDPRMGEPAASALWSVTAIAGACAQAEVAAKTALILGRERGAQFIEAARLGALLVAETGAWSATGAWPSAGMRRLERSDLPEQGAIS